MSKQNLKELWESNKFTELGDNLFNDLSQDEQVNWLHDLLLSAMNYDKNDNLKSIENLIKVVDNSSRWVECKEIFSEIRAETLKYEKLNVKDHYLIGVCYLSEYVAKILYNYIKPDIGGFDENQHRHIPSCIKYLVDYSNDESYRRRMIEFMTG